MNVRDDWNRVGDTIGGLALKLKLHFEQAAGGEAEETRRALDAVRDGVETAFDGLKAAIADPAMQQDVRDVATDLRDALGNTFAELSSQLQNLGKDHGAPAPEGSQPQQGEEDPQPGDGIADPPSENDTV